MLFLTSCVTFSSSIVETTNKFFPFQQQTKRTAPGRKSNKKKQKYINKEWRSKTKISRAKNNNGIRKKRNCMNERKQTRTENNSDNKITFGVRAFFFLSEKEKHKKKQAKQCEE